MYVLDLSGLGRILVAVGKAVWDGRTEGRWYVRVVLDFRATLCPQNGVLERTVFLTTLGDLWAIWEDRPYIDDCGRILVPPRMVRREDEWSPDRRVILEGLYPLIVRRVWEAYAGTSPVEVPPLHPGAKASPALIERLSSLADTARSLARERWERGEFTSLADLLEARREGVVEIV